MTETDADLHAASETAVRQCLDLQPGKSLVVAIDDKRKCISRALYEVAGKVTDDTIIVRYPPGNQHDKGPPAPAAIAMQACGVFLVPTTKNLSHTRARGNACGIGARGATPPGVTEEVFVTGLDADYSAIYDYSTAMSDAVGGTDEPRVAIEKGTDITFVRGGRERLAGTGAIAGAGPFPNLPTSEILLSSASATGTYVADETMMPHGLLNEGREFHFEVEDGHVTKISDDDTREQIEATAEEVGDDAYNLAEIGIGTNVGVTSLVGFVLLDEETASVVYITVGDDAGIGGDIGVPLHLDDIIREPAVYVDGEEVGLPQP